MKEDNSRHEISVKTLEQSDWEAEDPGREDPGQPGGSRFMLPQNIRQLLL